MFGWAARMGFGSVGPVIAYLVCRPAHLARPQEAGRTAGAWPRKKHGVGVSSGARLRPAPRAVRLALDGHRIKGRASPLG